jgi:hypothetical protein
MDYLDHPDAANSDEIYSLAILVHESMHIRGERDEAITECQAVQRNYRAAKLLEVSEKAARKTALAYYYGGYLSRATDGPMSAAYFSPECAQGKALDEHLSDSTWKLRLAKIDKSNLSNSIFKLD